MFHLRRIHDTLLPLNQAALKACGEILLEQIPTTTPSSLKRMHQALNNQVGERFKAVLLVAESRRKVQGFALVLHEVDLHFSYLEFVCAASRRTSGGLGSALYERCREEAAEVGSRALFMEVAPDHPAWCADAVDLKQNRARLRFYENWGARPVLGTEWDGGHAEEAPTRGSADLGKHHDPDNLLTYLVADLLGKEDPLPRKRFSAMLEALLERRFEEEVSPRNRRSLTTELRDPELQLRPFRYQTAPQSKAIEPRSGPLSVVIAQEHTRHWVRDRGYYEAPVRIRSITDALLPSGLVTEVPCKHWPDRWLRNTHDADYLRLLDELSRTLGTRSTYADIFPPRKRRLPPADPLAAVGWYCSDSFTPLSQAAIAAARHAVDCTLTSAELLLQGHPVAYALVRPPGHHAESRMFGGYCFLNNSAIAANFLLKDLERVAILDIDYHHGNGQQEIFYSRRDVLTVSIHGDPHKNYPYYAGFSDEVGRGSGKGFNLNVPLPSNSDATCWRDSGLEVALDRVRHFQPQALVLAAGLDTARADPTGTFTLVAKDFEEIGRTLGGLHLPTLVVQEGGYRTRNLGKNVTALLRGIARGAELLRN